MPVTPLVVVPHAGGPSTWEEAVARLGDALATHTEVTVTVRLPGAAVEHLAGTELWSRLDLDRVTFLSGGFTDPILALLPPSAQRLQMNREQAVMDAARISPGGLWVADAWDPGLVTRAIRAGLGLVFFPAELLDDPEPDLQPGAIERAGEAVIGVPVVNDDPPQGGFVAVRLAPGELDHFVRAHLGELDAAGTHLGRVGPGRRLVPRLHSPRLEEAQQLYYRKLLLAVRDQGERTSGQDTLLALQSRQCLFDPAAGTERDLLAARVDLDGTRHRGDTWARTSLLDWDADGVEEVRIETAHASLIVDPHRTAVRFWDDKGATWPVTSVDPSSPMMLVSRLDTDGGEVVAAPMRVTERSEGRAHAMVNLAGEDGTNCRLSVNGRILSIVLAVGEGEAVRVGPEIPLDLSAPRLRVDGGAWTDVTESTAVFGHRFRLVDDDRSMLISSLRPCELFIQPLDRGLMVWPHWLASGGDSYQVSFEPG